MSDNLFVSLEKDDKNVIISLDNIQKTYLLGVEGVPALRGVSLKIYRGEFIIIYGTSGGGKTSLLNIVGTIDKPTKGHLTICGQRITARTSDEDLAQLRLASMGFVFQTFNLLSTMTAKENVEMPMVLQGKLSKHDRAHRAIELLDKVGMGKRLDHHPSQLSGGEQQRVTIARAIANRPQILLLDEPTGDLDTKNGLIVMEMLTRLNLDDKITMVMVTHDPGLKNAAHRVVYMRDGKIQKVETISQEARAEYQHNLRVQTNVAITGNNLAAGIGRSDPFSAATEIRRPRDYETYSAEGVAVATTIIPKDIAVNNVLYPVEQHTDEHDNEFDILLPSSAANAAHNSKHTPPAAPTNAPRSSVSAGSSAGSRSSVGTPHSAASRHSASTTTMPVPHRDDDDQNANDDDEDPRHVVNHNAAVMFGGPSHSHSNTSSTHSNNSNSNSNSSRNNNNNNIVEIPLVDMPITAAVDDSVAIDVMMLNHPHLPQHNTNSNVVAGSDNLVDDTKILVS